MLRAVARTDGTYAPVLLSQQEQMLRISELFSRAYLAQIVDVRRAKFLASCENPQLSPIGIPANEAIESPLFCAYAGSTQLLLQRDALLCSYFLKFLETNGYEAPSFMQQDLGIADMAQRIRDHLEEYSYELKTLPRKDRYLFREVPPEAVLHFTMSVEILKKLYHHCMKFFTAPEPWCFEVAFAFFESGRLDEVLRAEPALWGKMRKWVLEEAIRTGRNQVVEKYLQWKGECKLVDLTKWKAMARAVENGAALELLDRKWEESGRSWDRKCCFPLEVKLGCHKISVDQEASPEVVFFRPIEPLQWRGLQVPEFSMWHMNIEGAVQEWEEIKEQIPEEYLECFAGPTGLFSSERPIDLATLNRYLRFTRERIAALGSNYDGAVQVLQQRDRLLVTFFEDYLLLHGLLIPLWMTEENLARKAEAIRKLILVRNYRLKDPYTSWEYPDGGGSYNNRDSCGHNGRNYPPEIAHFRMTACDVLYLLKHCYYNKLDEPLYALIENKFQFFAKSGFFNLEFSKLLLVKAIGEGRAEAVRILGPILKKYLTRAEKKICRTAESISGVRTCGEWL